MSFTNDIPQITNQLPQTINLPKINQPDLFQERLEDLLRNVSNSVNTKIGGVYDPAERGTGEQYFVDNNPQRYRQVYRKIFDMVDLNGSNIAPGATAGPFPHGITQVKESAHIWANCTADSGEIFSLMGTNVFADATNVTFTNNTPFTLTQADVILNLMKEN